jgi:nucleotide-binding universal stress UspA family protein
MFETVLFPIDQSRQTMETAAVALELAKTHGSRLVVLSVVEAEEGAMHDAAAVAKLLEQARASFEQAGVSRAEAVATPTAAPVIPAPADTADTAAPADTDRTDGRR